MGNELNSANADANINTHTALATLPDLQAIVDGYNKALALYVGAFDRIEAADRAISAAYATFDVVTPGAKFHSGHDATEVNEFHKAVQLPDKHLYMKTARKLLTLRGWHYIIDRCGLQQLMDAQAKKEFDSQLRYVPERRSDYRNRNELITEEETDKGPPPFTVDNINATLRRFAGDADMIWKRGIANVFSQLDRRFRSHDGFKVGSRIIINHIVDSFGHVSTYGNSADRFRDIERTFIILDGLDPRSARSDFLHSISKERDELKLGYRPEQSEHENKYFKLRIYKNGNAHLWFTRDDLVEKVNKELALYYGEVIGDSNTKEADPLESRALTPARMYGFFPTPISLAEKIVRQVPWQERPLRLLEPSAGTGNISRLLTRSRYVETESGAKKPWSAVVDVIELQRELANKLSEAEIYNKVTCADFLQVAPTPLYNGIVMNPPFDRERDIDHVTHAMKFLKPADDSFLLSIISAGIEFRETRKAAAFRKLLDSKKGWMMDLPTGSFAEVGTHVNTILIGFGVRKPYYIE